MWSGWRPRLFTDDIIFCNEGNGLVEENLERRMFSLEGKRNKGQQENTCVNKSGGGIRGGVEVDEFYKRETEEEHQS